MKHNQLSPLSVFIMAQALDTVKVPDIQGDWDEDGVEMAPQGRLSWILDLLGADIEATKKLVYVDWPHIKSLMHQSWFFAGYSQANLCSLDGHLLSAHGDKCIVPVDRLSQDVIQEICRAKEAKKQVWVAPRSPDFWKSLGDGIFLPDQVGFGWCVLDNHREHYESSKNLWRYFFANENSLQWIWPWCNIIQSRIAASIKGVGLQKTWASDKRQKNAWIKLEEDVMSHFEVILGGSAMTKLLIAAVAVKMFSTKEDKIVLGKD